MPSSSALKSRQPASPGISRTCSKVWRNLEQLAPLLELAILHSVVEAFDGQPSKVLSTSNLMQEASSCQVAEILPRRFARHVVAQ
jgi:hypothetical protein